MQGCKGVRVHTTHSPFPLSRIRCRDCSRGSKNYLLNSHSDCLWLCISSFFCFLLLLVLILFLVKYLMTSWTHNTSKRHGTKISFSDQPLFHTGKRRDSSCVDKNRGIVKTTREHRPVGVLWQCRRYVNVVSLPLLFRRQNETEIHLYN